jgi:hypothetical protein
VQLSCKPYLVKYFVLCALYVGSIKLMDFLDVHSVCEADQYCKVSQLHIIGKVCYIPLV